MIRGRSDTPVIILTAHRPDRDRRTRIATRVPPGASANV
jgi:hypothetical protein